MKNILVALEMSKGDDKIVEQASILAAKFGAKVWLIHVAAPDPDFVGFDAGPAYVRKTLADDLRAEHKTLQNYALALKAAKIEAEGLLVQGPTVETIFHETEKLSADLLIIGSHKHGFLRRFFGDDVSRQVVERSDIPMLVVPIRNETT